MATSMDQTVDPEELRRFVADVADLDPAVVTDDAHFTAELGVDSLKALEVLVALERKYEIQISEDEMRDMVTFADVRDLVQEKVASS